MDRVKNQNQSLSYFAFAVSFVWYLAQSLPATAQEHSEHDAELISAAMMSWDEYAKREFPKPYSFQFERPEGGKLFYFGAEHSSDPAHAQFAKIERYWKEFQPEVAFVEGRLPPVRSDRETAIRENGEPGFVAFMANRDNIPVASMDSSIDEQAAFLLKRLPPDQAKLFFVLRQVVRHKRFRDVRSLDEEVLPKYFLELARIDGLDDGLSNVQALEVCFGKYFDKGLSYRDAVQHWYDPLGGVNWVNEASKSLADERNCEMVRQIMASLRSGRRVFAVVGRTHAIMQEKALKKLMN